jgi:hypothetical protein
MSNRAQRRAAGIHHEGNKPVRADVPMDELFGQRNEGNGDPRVLNFESMVSAIDGAPLVKMQWGQESGQMTVGEARAHALHVLEVAEAAEYDAAYWHFLTTEMQVERQEAAFMCGLLREHRGKSRGFLWKTGERPYFDERER